MTAGRLKHRVRFGALATSSEIFRVWLAEVVVHKSGVVHQTADGRFLLHALVRISGAYSEEYLRRCS